MCGFAGYISSKGNGVPIMTVYKMNQVISHRGPDDEGYLFFEKNNAIIAGGESTPDVVWNNNLSYCPKSRIELYEESKSSVVFSHKRLSIIDLGPTGHQPMSYLFDRFWIVYNGEIYNYKEIREELITKGHQFTTDSDTEVILAAYAEWGEHCLNRFVGMWAFVILDTYKMEVFLSRDRYGIKPFYYYFSESGDLYLGSEIKQFTTLDNWQSKLNPQRAYDQLVYAFTDHTDETMFDRVFQLPPGSYYKSYLSEVQATSEGKLDYLNWYQLSHDQFSGSFKEAAAIFRELFERAVYDHLQADVPVGTALSGGLDSSSIVCEVNKILQSNGNYDFQKTFSSCSADRRFSERKWMDIVINHVNVDSHFVYPELKDAVAMTPDILWTMDEPYQSQSAFLGFNVFKLASEKNVKVLLNGQGADEYLGGYGQFTVSRYARMLKGLRFNKLYNDLVKSRLINMTSFHDVLLAAFLSLLPDGFQKSLKSIRSSSDKIRRIINLDRLEIEHNHPFDHIPVKYRSVPEISQHLTFYSTLPKYLRWEDRNSMAHSVEARVPFLDHRLVEFAYSLPDEFLEKGGWTKRVMREAMKGLLPEKIIYRKDKQGFITPEEKWVKYENPKLFRNLIAESIEISNGIINTNALDYFDRIINNEEPFDYTYWRIILFGKWIDRFNVQTIR